MERTPAPRAAPTGAGTASRGTTVPSNGGPVPVPPAVALRDFQQQIVALAREQNVVMVGETGIGKTFVAIALLSEQDYSGGRRAFFLAPTRQLVWQITAKIRASSTLRANAYCGKAMEQWGEREWRRELALMRVFVCTPEVLRMALERGFVSMDMINLLVFDECHHVTKRHPYAHVIKMYDANRQQEMPRVFGTTACPTRDCAKNLYAKLHKVELQKHETVAFAAVAPIEFVTYDKDEPMEKSTGQANVGPTTTTRASDSDSDDAELEQWLHGEFKDSVYAPLLDKLVESNAVVVLDKLLRKGRSDAAKDDARRAKLLRKFVLTCVEMYKNWGLWCVYKYIELEIERAAQNASPLMALPGTMYGFDSAAIKTIMLARHRRGECAFASSKRLAKVVELMETHTEVDDVRRTAVDDERGVLPSEAETTDVDSDFSGDESDLDPEIVASPSISRRTTKKLQGIIFVTTRAECRILCEFLNEKMGYDETEDASYDDEENHGSFGAQVETSKTPRFGCVLGQAATRDTASFNMPKMEETLTKFEQGSIQFLVSTAVSIEGVDFPQCALIIVADRIPAARKLIQLRGRARHEDGVVYYLAEDGDLNHCVHFHVMETEAAAINTLDFSHDKQETILQQPRTQAAAKLAGFNFFPAESKIVIESTGAVLDLDSSVSRLNMFCQTLPPQLYTIDNKTMYTFIQEEVMRRPYFRATLQLPVELNIPPFQTELMHSKATAKAAAAFLGCKHLLENGLLDQSLNSVYRKGKSTATLDVDNLSYFLNRLNHK